MTLNHTNKQAFTLTELLAVIAIMAALMLVAVPSLRSIRSTALQTAARQVSNTLQLTRQYAITHRTPTRFMIAVDTSSGKIAPDMVARAFIVCTATNNTDGILQGWVPVQDWQMLPEGVVFSDLNSRFYDPIEIHLTDDKPPPVGVADRTAGTAASSSTAWQYYDSVSTSPIFINGISETWTYSSVEFRPTGLVASDSIPGNVPTAGIRIVQGSVLEPTTLSLLVTDSNNWVYIEYDELGGRIRTRFKDTYRYKP